MATAAAGRQPNRDTKPRIVAFLQRRLHTFREAPFAREA